MHTNGNTVRERVAVTVNNVSLSGFEKSETNGFAERLEAYLAEILEAANGPARFSDGHTTRNCPRIRVVVDSDCDMETVLRRTARQIYVQNFQMTLGHLQEGRK